MGRAGPEGSRPHGRARLPHDAPSRAPLGSAGEPCPGCSFWHGDANCRAHHCSAGVWAPSNPPSHSPCETPAASGAQHRTAPASPGTVPRSVFSSVGCAAPLSRGNQNLFLQENTGSARQSGEPVPGDAVFGP